MPTLITKDVECPAEGCDSIIEVEFDPAELDKEVTCPECGEVVPFEYDAATETITVMEYDDEADDAEDAEDFDDEDEEDEE